MVELVRPFNCITMPIVAGSLVPAILDSVSPDCTVYVLS